jgi:biopolymer transport protein ExbB
MQIPATRRPSFSAALLLPLFAATAASLAAGQESGPQQSPATAPAVEAAPSLAQPAAPGDRFGQAVGSIQAELQRSLEELGALREQILAERRPLGARLTELEAELSAARQAVQDAARSLDTRTVDLSRAGEDRAQLEGDVVYLSSLLSDYVRNFDSGLHIADLQRYGPVLEAARLAPENSNLSRAEVFAAQLELLSASFGRLEEALGGTRFPGTAVDETGLVREGQFALIGPLAYFLSADGTAVGTAEERLGSGEPALLSFATPEDSAAASEVLGSGQGLLPIDPTLGNAHKLAATSQTFAEHVQAGGPVMIPIFVMAAAALLVALFKWLSFFSLRAPPKLRVAEVLDAVGAGDEATAKARAARLPGPVGRLLRIGVEHLREPRELIEEAMYEFVLATKLRTQRFLPFIAVCAASAPLLGLLGTVTGIIQTFKLITVFGSGDVKMLSGGISEALITTEWGLIVAIPSLLLHSFLSRRARGVIDQLESTSVALLNQVSRGLPAAAPVGAVASGAVTSAPAAPAVEPLPDERVRAQVQQVLSEMLTPRTTHRTEPRLAEAKR